MVTGNPGPVIPSRYVAALGGHDPIESQRKAPKRIKKLLRGLNEKQLAKKPAPGKWSIKDVIAHLADGEIIIGSRVRFVAAMDRPAILGYDQDAFVDRLGIESVKTSELFDAFVAVRSANVALMERLPKDALSRVGLHSERGEESIAAMLVMYAGHDRIHEAQIEGLRTALLEEKTARKRAAKSDKKSKSKLTGDAGKPSTAHEPAAMNRDRADERAKKTEGAKKNKASKKDKKARKAEKNSGATRADTAQAGKTPRSAPATTAP